MYVCMYVRTYVCIYVWIYVCIYVCSMHIMYVYIVSPCITNNIYPHVVCACVHTPVSSCLQVPRLSHSIQSLPARLPHPKLVPPLRGWQPKTRVPLGGYPGSCLPPCPKLRPHMTTHNFTFTQSPLPLSLSRYISPPLCIFRYMLISSNSTNSIYITHLA